MTQITNHGLVAWAQTDLGEQGFLFLRLGGGPFAEGESGMEEDVITGLDGFLEQHQIGRPLNALYGDDGLGAVDFEHAGWNGETHNDSLCKKLRQRHGGLAQGEPAVIRRHERVGVYFETARLQAAVHEMEKAT